MFLPTVIAPQTMILLHLPAIISALSHLCGFKPQLARSVILLVYHIYTPLNHIKSRGYPVKKTYQIVL
jgi:hypothetical protein